MCYNHRYGNLIKSKEDISISEIDNLLVGKNDKPVGDNQKVHYVNNKELHQAFIEYHKEKQRWIDEGKEGNPQYNDVIAKAILQIANNALYAPRFIAYTNNWKDEMREYAIELCVRYAHNYNPHYNDELPEDKRKTPNPFSYLTQFCRNAYFQVIKKESHKKYAHFKILVEQGFSSFENDHGTFDDKYMTEVYEYIDKYEKIQKDLEEKKQMKKEMKNVNTNIQD